MYMKYITCKAKHKKNSSCFELRQVTTNPIIFFSFLLHNRVIVKHKGENYPVAMISRMCPR